MKSPEELLDGKVICRQVLHPFLFGKPGECYVFLEQIEDQIGFIENIQADAIASVAQIDDRDVELVNNAIGFWQSAFWEDDIKEPNPAT